MVHGRLRYNASAVIEDVSMIEGAGGTYAYLLRLIVRLAD